MPDLEIDELQALAIDTFTAFSDNPKEWPDIVQFNRSGVSDVNIRGIWSFEDRTEFFNAPFPERIRQSVASIPTRPESSGITD